MRKAPTKPGFYWLRVESWAPCRVTERSSGLRVSFIGLFYPMQLADFTSTHPTAEWGPEIEPPVAPGVY